MRNYTIPIFINLILCVIFLLSVSEDPDLFQFMLYLFAPVFILQLAGAVLLSTARYKLGYKLYVIGNAVFIPLGLIGIYGATKSYDAKTELEFEQRRKEKSEAKSKEQKEQGVMKNWDNI